MFRKTRIRSLVAISALTGATVLGGAGLAGATGGSDTEDQKVDDQELVFETQAAVAGDEMSTGEPEAPTLPDQAADQASEALAERFAGGASEDEASDAGADSNAAVANEDSTAEVPAEDQGSHGERVSEVATSGSGEGHGEEVSSVATQQGEERRQAAQENRPERGGDDGETVEENQDLEE